ncbi:MAG: ABC transporter permease subunit [Chloroflexi bacterium]|nr:ABC transporter permease subunit [Chloroflexota bacterium]
MTAVGYRTGLLADPVAARRALVVVLAAAAALAWVLFRGQWRLPHNDDEPLFRSLNEVHDIVARNRDLLAPVRVVVGGLIDVFNEITASLGWPGVLGLAGALGFLFGGWRLALLGVLGFASLGVLGLWDESMLTLGMMLAAVVIALLIGLPLGILAGRSNRVSGILSPILDVMQIMPTLAYLTPITLLFLIGATPSTIATLIFAMPAAIRITALGVRGVAPSTVEAARSLGATDRQILRKVQIPLARRAIGLAINQTIMLGLSMIVITGLIGAPGLGLSLTQSLNKHDVGSAFDSGIAIVILAIILDRLTFAAGEWLDPKTRIGQVPSPRWLSIGVPVAILVAGLAAPFIVDATAFPDAIAFSFRSPINEFTNWLTDTFQGITLSTKDIITAVVINPLEGFLKMSPWWLLIAIVALIAWAVSGRRPAIIAAICLGLIALLGLWEHSMETLTTVLVGTLLTLILGIAVGVQTARHDRLRAVLRPILDTAQTMPAFVYLIPALALFSPTRFTAIVAAIIYAAPPVIRLVEVGIRAVPATVMEAALASGATRRQLLWKVQLPMSSRALLLAANQGIVMVLSMVVIGGLVGAGALGFDVITGFARGEQFGKGLAAGVAIVLLGIMLDRITQGAGGRSRRTMLRARAG